MKNRWTTYKRAVRTLLAAAACTVFMTGCGLPGGPRLDATDRKFAAFYGEYLVRTGSADPSDSIPGEPMTSADIDSMFVRHGIDQKTFDTKLRSYSKDPALWREVLGLVRKNLRGEK